MDSFTIQLAGCRVAVQPLYPYIREYCQGYLTDAPADFGVAVTQADIALEREKSAREDGLEGDSIRQFSDEYLETLAVYRKIAGRMLDYDTLLFHGSALALDGAGYLFTAKSGTGKSTHARLWRQQFGERVVMVNDDKPLLRITDAGVTVCGTPWNGKHRLGSPMTAPLKAVCILSRDRENHIAPISVREAYPMLVQQTYRPADPAAMAKTLALIDRLAGAVELYALGCNMEQEAAQIAYNGMK